MRMPRLDIRKNFHRPTLKNAAIIREYRRFENLSPIASGGCRPGACLNNGTHLAGVLNLSAATIGHPLPYQDSSEQRVARMFVREYETPLPAGSYGFLLHHQYKDKHKRSRRRFAVMSGTHLATHISSPAHKPRAYRAHVHRVSNLSTQTTPILFLTRWPVKIPRHNARLPIKFRVQMRINYPY